MSSVRRADGHGEARKHRANIRAIGTIFQKQRNAMASNVIDWWGDLPPPMKDAIEQFRGQPGSAIDSVEFVKRALDRQVPEIEREEGPI